MLLRKHHRILVNSFRQYQLTNLKGPPRVDERFALLTGGIQDEREELIDEAALEELKLSEDQMTLLSEVANKLNIEEDGADVRILYEVTGFMQEVADDPDFWQEYLAIDDDAFDPRIERECANDEAPMRKQTYKRLT